MIKKMTYENIDSGETLEVHFELRKDGDRWSAQLKKSPGEQEGPGAPVFYGMTADQAERQLRKVFDKDHDLVAQAVVEE